MNIGSILIGVNIRAAKRTEEGFIRLKIIEETEAMGKSTPHSPMAVILKEEKYEELADKYGVYAIDWYFTRPDSIKYFDDEEQKWHYNDNPYEPEEYEIIRLEDLKD